MGRRRRDQGVEGVRGKRMEDCPWGSKEETLQLSALPPDPLDIRESG